MALLRESSKAKGEIFDLAAIVGGGSDGGVAHGAALAAFAEAAIGTDDRRLASERENIGVLLGEAALVDAAAIVATFNAIDRVADSTGIPIEDMKAEITADFRDTLGLNQFAEQRGEMSDPRGRKSDR